MNDVEVVRLCRTLADLLENPQPGISSWVEARNRIGVGLYGALREKLPSALVNSYPD